jgi:transposase-like protein
MNDDEKLDKITELLEEILKWTRFEGSQRVKEILLDELDTDAKKIVYELSDGRSSPEIAKIVGVDPTTIRNWWKKWSKIKQIRIIEPCLSYKKRFHKVFSLDEVGIEIPKIKKAKLTKQKEKQLQK